MSLESQPQSFTGDKNPREDSPDQSPYGETEAGQRVFDGQPTAGASQPEILEQPVKNDDPESDPLVKRGRRRFGAGVAAAVLAGAVGGGFGGYKLFLDKDDVGATPPPPAATSGPVAGMPPETAPSSSAPEVAPQKPTLETVVLYDQEGQKLTGVQELIDRAKIPAEAASNKEEAAQVLFETVLPRLINTGANDQTKKLYDTDPNPAAVQEHTKLFNELGVSDAVVDSLFATLDPNNKDTNANVQDRAALKEYVRKLHETTAYLSEVTPGRAPTKPKSVTTADVGATDARTVYKFPGVEEKNTFATKMVQVDGEWKIQYLKEIPTN